MTMTISDTTAVIDDDITNFFNSISFPEQQQTIVVVNKQRRFDGDEEIMKKCLKRVRRLEKEKDTLNKEMLVLRVRFDNLEEKMKYLEGESRTRKSAVIRDLSEIKNY